jgi:hypothetical protein
LPGALIGCGLIIIAGLIAAGYVFHLTWTGESLDN